MEPSQHQRALAFRQLHQADDLFLMPNVWSPGSARLLADCGFAALGTSSAGLAFHHGLPDYADSYPRDLALRDTRAIAQAIDLPLSADTESGYGDTPEAVADAMRLFVEAGAVGLSIEDHFGASDKLIGRGRAVERVAAARAGCDAGGLPIVLTARAECFLTGHPDPLSEGIERLNLYREAGADCLYLPGVTSAADIATLVREVDGPINAVMGLAGAPLCVMQLRDLGVRRVSIGGSLARASYGLLRRAAQEMLGEGTFSFSDGQIADTELCELFARGS